MISYCGAMELWSTRGFFAAELFVERQLAGCCRRRTMAPKYLDSEADCLAFGAGLFGVCAVSFKASVWAVLDTAASDGFFSTCETAELGVTV